MNCDYYDDAIRSFHKAISIDPSVAEVFNNLGNAQRNAWVKLMRQSKAIRKLQYPLTKISSRDTSILVKPLDRIQTSGRIYCKCLERAISCESKICQGLFNSLGLSFAMLGKLNSAIDCS
jgi:tetratricopeptide (TPR) repeat protein